MSQAIRKHESHAVFVPHQNRMQLESISFFTTLGKIAVLYCTVPYKVRALG
jgi:hypothetical protein